MNDNDMIRRGDALQAAKGFIGAETAIATLPAVTLPDVAKVVEEAGRLEPEIRKLAWSSAHETADTLRALITLATAQAAQIAGLQRTYDDLYSDALADAKSDAQDFESDLWAVVRGYLDELHFDWRDFMEDGVTADEAMSHIRECMDEETRHAEAAETALAAERAKVARLVEALRPFDACVFNDNGDITISNGDLKRRDWLALRAALSEAEGRT